MVMRLIERIEFQCNLKEPLLWTFDKIIQPIASRQNMWDLLVQHADKEKRDYRILGRENSLANW